MARTPKRLHSLGACDRDVRAYIANEVAVNYVRPDIGEV